jgi:hypothetical protein
MSFDIVGFSHIGFVGPSIEDFFGTWGRALGITDWLVYDDGAPGGFQIHGKVIEGQTRARTSFAKVGGTCIELIQPVENVIPHREHMDEVGPSIHHIAFWVDDLEKQVVKAGEMGWDLVYSPISLHPGLRERQVSATTSELGWATNIEYPPFFGFLEPHGRPMKCQLELLDSAFVRDYHKAYGDYTFYPGDLPS